MSDQYSTTELLNFLDHAADRGLMPAATARALAVAARNVFGVLTGDEVTDVRRLDLDAVVRRFENKRARDFTPDSLQTYASRVRRAVALFVTWRDAPASFKVKTRSTAASRQRDEPIERERPVAASTLPSVAPGESAPGTYQTAFPLRAGRVVTLLNVPEDLSVGEAERLADFVRMLALK